MNSMMIRAITNSSAANNNSHTFFLNQAFIDDSFSIQCEEVQCRPFLRSGIVPTVGQRIELLMLLNTKKSSNHRNDKDGGETGEDDSYDEVKPFRLSGEVVQVKPMPVTWGTCESHQHEHEAVSTVGNNDIFCYPRRVSMSSIESNSHDSMNENNECITSSSFSSVTEILRPATPPQDSGPGLGSLHLADIVRYFSSRQVIEKMEEPTPELLRKWEEMSLDMKQRICEFIVERYGAVHGQVVVCEGRLNFDYDMRRGTVNGPWADLIPFDGRDIWRFTLLQDDRYDRNTWQVSDPSSFVNLGRRARNLCWPWTDDNSLPFERTGADAPLAGSRPNGSLLVHASLGPFLDRKKPQAYQAYAA